MIKVDEKGIITLNGSPNGLCVEAELIIIQLKELLLKEGETDILNILNWSLGLLTKCTNIEEYLELKIKNMDGGKE